MVLTLHDGWMQKLKHAVMGKLIRTKTINLFEFQFLIQISFIMNLKITPKPCRILPIGPQNLAAAAKNAG